MLSRALVLAFPAWVLAGCDKVESDFVLTVKPRSPLDQRPFDSDASVRLVITDAQGSDVLALDDGEGGPGRSDLPPLDDAWLGLLLDLPAASGSGYDAASLYAWGQTGPFDLARDDTVDATVLVAEYGRVGDLEVLPAGIGTIGSALALTGGGDAWVFGGADAYDPISTLALSRQLRMTDWNEGDWRFQEVAPMPSVLGASARFEPTATVVDTDGGEAILVAGGRANGASLAGNLQTAFLLDAATGTATWSGATSVPRSGHAALRMGNGRVLLVGGIEGTDVGTEPVGASFEVFAAEWLAFDAGEERLEVPARGFGLASLGPDGVLVCGGSVPGVTEVDPRTPSATCQRISLLGNVQAAADLPVALADLAMAPAGPGKVLACGGVDQPVSGATDAIARSWLYDAALDGWTEVGAMASARARHALVATPDGRVVVVGGSASVGAGRYDVGAPVECVEVFDPGTGTFDQVECTGTGAGGSPLAADGRQGLAIVLSGTQADRTSGRTYGVVGTGPDL